MVFKSVSSQRPSWRAPLGRDHPAGELKYMKTPTVYIITNKRNGTLYTGVTSNLFRRIYEHRDGLVEGFAKKYDCKILVFYEMHTDMVSAIKREKQIKDGSRRNKLKLIERMNPEWENLYRDIIP